MRRSDVIVIGGGPAGSTAATLLRRRGWNVVLFERESHPRFHIGESLLPMNIPILEELGVLDEVRRIGTYKLGADFTASGDLERYQSFPFSRALGDSPDYAFQVRRSEFDQLLFTNSRAAGVSAFERHRVTRVVLGGLAPNKVFVQDGDGNEQEWECGYLIDASGQDTVVAAQERWRVKDPRHAAAAMFAHFEGVERRTASEAGNISIYWFDAGWIWMIPLADGTMSVGAVCRPDYLKTRSGGPDEFLLETIRRNSAAQRRFERARQLTPVRSAANYTYSSRTQVGQGFALIGDAYAFVDPIFSSGVYLAMSSATRIVPAVDCWLNGKRAEYPSLVTHYSRRIRRGLDTFRWFIFRFSTPAMAALFRAPRNIFQVEQAVISMLAGDVYEGRGIRSRLMIFKVIFAITALLGRGPVPKPPGDNRIAQTL